MAVPKTRTATVVSEKSYADRYVVSEGVAV
jgi:hypothetical protein